MDGDRIVAFGPQAEAWARRLPPTVNAVVAQEETWDRAFDAAVSRRRQGIDFLAAPLVRDHRARFALAHAAALLGETNDANAQLAGLDRLAAVSAEPAHRLIPPSRVLRDFILIGTGVAVRSLAEYRRLTAALGLPGLSRLSAVALPDPAVPAECPEGERDTVVIWGPEHSAAELALLAFTLAVRGQKAVAVCRAGTIGGLPVEFVQPDQAAAVLARATLIVDATVEDPGPALSLAGCGRPMLAHSGSGAHERLDDLLLYDLWDHRSLHAALDAAATAPAPRPRTPAGAPGPAAGRPLVAGARAARWAGRASGGPTITLSDDAGTAIPDGTEETIDGASMAPFLTDLRIAHVQRNAHNAWLGGASYDLRRDAFDALAAQCGPAQPLPLQSGVARNEGVAILGYAARAHRVVVPSWLEADRLGVALGRRLLRVDIDPRPDRLVPLALISSQRADAVVVWAPNADESTLLVILMGLTRSHRHVIVVGAKQVAGAEGAFVPIEDGAAALSRALAVVDATVDDPGSALALAALGLRLAVASTSGADEYLDGATVYDPWSHVSVANAVASAVTAEPATPRRLIAREELAGRLRYYASGVAEDGPLVSVLMMTRDRKAWVERALTSVAKQRYRNIEAVLIRNGGVRLDDLPARFPFLRLIDLEENLGPTGGANAARELARGEYVAYLADDDAYLPDHIGRGVAALERTGEVVSHAGMLAVHLYSSSTSAGYDEVGYGVECIKPVDIATLLAANDVSSTSMVISTSRLPVDPAMDDSFGPLADYEFILRIAVKRDYTFIDRVTIEQSYRVDASQFGARKPESTPQHLRALFAAYPVPDHPWTERMRRAMEQHFDNHAALGSNKPVWFPPPTISVPPRPFVRPVAEGPSGLLEPSDISVIRQPEQMNPAALNAAWRAAQAPYLVFTAGAELAPHALAALHDALDGEAHGATARICTNGRQIVEAGLALQDGRFVPVLSGAPADHPNALAPRDLDFLSPRCFALRRSLLEELGGFDERYTGALCVLDLCVRARLRGARLQYRPDAVAIAAAPTRFTERGDAEFFAAAWREVFRPPLQSAALVGGA